jgi:predicted MPP superfamily phosphohydrolase
MISSLYGPQPVFAFFIMQCYVMHCYVCWRFALCFQGLGRKIFSAAYFGGISVFLAFILLRYYDRIDSGARISEIMFGLSITDFVLVSMTASFLAVADVLKICLGLWDRFRKTNLEARITPKRAAVFTLAAVVIVFAYGYFEAWNVREVNITIKTDKLPDETERLRIVQISDIHLGGIYRASRLERVMQIVRSAEPDILVVTGDLVDGNMEYRRRESKILSSHGARYGAFAVTGNQEYYDNLDDAKKFIADSGFTLLDDEKINVAGISITGLDDGTSIVIPRLYPTEGRFSVVLKHHPQIPKLNSGEFDLQISGHTHGGQIWLCRPAMERAYGVKQGLSRNGGGYVYVSNGAGFWGPPIRILAPPEVTVFDLVR